MIYCTNRPCSLWLVRLPEVGGGGEEEGGKAAPLPPPAPRCLTPTLLSSMSPRFSPRGDKLAFLSHDAAVSSGAHFATAALLSLDFDPATAEPKGPRGSPGPGSRDPRPLQRAVVPAVGRPRSPDHFPGIYAANLPDRPFVTDSVLALTSQWRSSTEVLLVDLETGEVACASKPGGPEGGTRGGTRGRRASEARSDGDGGSSSPSSFPGSWAFLAALPPSATSDNGSNGGGGGGGGGWLAAVDSSPTCPPDVVVADFSSATEAEAQAQAASSSSPSPPGVAAVAARLRWRRAARADGSPPPLRAPAAAAMSRVTTTVIEVAVAPAKPRPRPKGEESQEEDENDEDGEDEVDNTIEVIIVSPSNSSSPSSSTAPALPPALVVPHGGPHAAHADSWELPTSFLAACGFCVLLVNFRGSTVRFFIFRFLSGPPEVERGFQTKKTHALFFPCFSL